MADIRRSMLELFQQGVDVVNRVMTRVTNSTMSKMDELALRNQRKELVTAISSDVYEQWRKGEKFSDELTQMLKQLSDIDDQLLAIEKRKYETVKEPDAPVSPVEPEVSPAAQPQMAPDQVETTHTRPDIPSVKVDMDQAPTQERTIEETVPTIHVEDLELPPYERQAYRPEVPGIKLDEPEESATKE